MRANIIPKDSCIQEWLKGLAISEVPISYQIVCGLSLIGAVLKRNVFVDQELWKIYPNISVLLVGPSGIGKDTVIDQAVRVLGGVGSPEILAGRTIEILYERMLRIGEPACCVIPAREVSAFFGGKDYQKGMVQELTDLLSTGEYVDISTKGGGVLKIKKPTVSMWAGSTVDWLHKAMPEGSLEGGLWPRFLIICEEYGSKHVPLIKHSLNKREKTEAHCAMEGFEERLKEIAQKYTRRREIVLLKDAQDLYTNWYMNRIGYFSTLVKPYANRSRDMVLRIAMVSAISRGVPYIEAVDVQVGIEVLGEVAKTIDKAVQPPTLEGRIGEDVFGMVPCGMRELMIVLGRKYNSRVIKETLGFLVETGQVKQVGGKVIRG